MQSQGQFIAESSQRPSATQLQTCSRGTVDGLLGEASKYAAVAPESQTSARAKGTMRPSSNHTRAFVAHCPHASQGYSGRHMISAAIEAKRKPSHASSSIQAHCCQRVSCGRTKADVALRTAATEMRLGRVAQANNATTATSRGAPMEILPKPTPVAESPCIHSVSASAPMK